MAAVTGLLALCGVYRPSSQARLIWPVLAFLIGFFLFIPVEAQSRTYEQVGWWDVLLSAVPEHRATWLRDWLFYLPQRHVIQHKLGAICIMAIGLIEFRRAKGRLPGQAQALALPALSTVAPGGDPAARCHRAGGCGFPRLGRAQNGDNQCHRSGQAARRSCAGLAPRYR